MPTRHYTKAPLTEAIIDIRIAPKDSLSLDEMTQFEGQVLKDYPEKKPIFRAKSTFKLGQQIETQTEQKQVGIIFVSADEKTLFQARVDGFTLNKLPPYGDWDTFAAEAKRLWGIYSKIIKPESIQRLAVRYINQIHFPEGIDQFTEYFTLYPKTPDLGQRAEFFMQAHYLLDSINAKLLLNVGILPPQKKGHTSVALDFDVFRDKDIPTKDGDMWAFFGQLREAKNKAFEECITEKTRTLIA